MQLYYFETPNTRKPCAVARHVDAPVDFVHVDLAKGRTQGAGVSRPSTPTAKSRSCVTVIPICGNPPR